MVCAIDGTLPSPHSQCLSVRSKGRPFGVRPVTAAVSRADLAVEDLLAERDLVLGLPRRGREIGSRLYAGIGMDAFRRLRLATNRTSRFMHCRRRGSRLNSRGFDIAM